MGIKNSKQRPYKFVDGKRVSNLDDRSCAQGSEMFKPKIFTNKYCSIKCYWKDKKGKPSVANWSEESRSKLSKKYLGSGNPMFGKTAWSKGKKRPEISGENHPNYKGGWVQSGYRYLCIEGEQTPEHKHIMEKHLGRKLDEQEVVHHINENKLDNRLENLMVMTRAEHMIHHKPRRKYQGLEI